MRLYHGSQNEVVMPRYGLGQDQHDFGRGFYLTDTEELAKEWAVYKPKSADGWVHAFDFDLEGLRVLDYRNGNVFALIAELMRHRDADESAAYRRRVPLFIEKYCVKEADDYDVVIGWRARGFARDQDRGVPSWLCAELDGAVLCALSVGEGWPKQRHRRCGSSRMADGGLSWAS